MTNLRQRLTVGIFCALLVATTAWPFLLPGDLLWRDMFVPATPQWGRWNLDSFAGLRAMPQDAILAFIAPIIPATIIAKTLYILAAFIGSISAFHLAGRIASATPSPANTHRYWLAGIPAAVLTLWNPYVAERLVQGHWSLVMASFMLPTVVLLLQSYPVNADRRSHHSPRWFAVGLGLVISWSAWTPTGWVLAVLTALTWGAGRRLLITGWSIFTALPWVVPVLYRYVAGDGDAVSVTTTNSAAQAAALAFSARAEATVGTWGALLGLGGIWNADVVPTARSYGWAVSGVILGLILVAALIRWKEYRCALVIIAATTIPAALATSVGTTLMGTLINILPPAGLLRDTHKFVIIMLPAFIIGIGILVRHCTQRWRLPVAGTVLVLTIANVPLLPADIRPITPHPLPAHWYTATSYMNAHPRGRVLVLPVAGYRSIDDRPVVDPTTKLVRTSVVNPNILRVNGQSVGVDAPADWTIVQDFAANPRSLSRHDVGYVMIDQTNLQESDRQRLATLVADFRPVSLPGAGGSLRLYEVPD